MTVQLALYIKTAKFPGYASKEGELEHSGNTMAEAPDTSCPDEVDIEAIIKEVMKNEKLYPREIVEEPPFNVETFIKAIKSPKKEDWSRRYFHGHAYGQFKCDNNLCTNPWSSAYAWCVLDLKEQKVEMKFKQQCADVKSHKDIKKLSLSEATPEDTSIEEKDAEYKLVLKMKNL